MCVFIFFSSLNSFELIFSFCVQVLLFLCVIVCFVYVLYLTYIFFFIEVFLTSVDFPKNTQREENGKKYFFQLRDLVSYWLQINNNIVILTKWVENIWSFVNDNRYDNDGNKQQQQQQIV